MDSSTQDNTSEVKTPTNAWTYKFRDGDTRTLTGTSRCLCHECREVFNSPSSFDRHQVNGVCMDPLQRGMVKNKARYWCTSLADDMDTSRFTPPPKHRPVSGRNRKRRPKPAAKPAPTPAIPASTSLKEPRSKGPGLSGLGKPK